MSVITQHLLGGDVLGTTEGSIVAASVDGERADAGSTYRRGTAVDLISL